MPVIRSRLKYAVGALLVALLIGFLHSQDADAASDRRPATAGGMVTTTAAGVPPGVPEASVTVDGLRLRSAPGYGGAVHGLLFSGDRVFIKERFAPSYNPDWVGVKLTEDSSGGLPYKTFGYVHKSYLYGE